MIARFHYDDETLGSLLRDDNNHDNGEVAQHVEACEQCQVRLETITQDGLTWEEAGKLLRDDSLDDAIEIGRRRSGGEASILQPSDHPNSLGRFGRYEILQLLGRGGMGIVMRGFDPALNRYSAVKVLAPELASSAAARRRFSREAKSAAAVVHPHVVPIQTVDEHAGLPYLVMPVVEGRSLQQRVDQNGPLDVIEVIRIAAQVAEGLAAAHAQGLVHRDIKPANILLENGVERVQITDFGLARAADDASMTASGVIAGTPHYMSPEQAHGDEIDTRSDLFSLGSVIYFMLTGHSPFRAENTMGVLNRIANDHPRRLRSIDPDIPAWLQNIVARLLEKNPDKRFESAAQVARELKVRLAELQDASGDNVDRPRSLDRRWPPTLHWGLLAGGAAFAIWLASVFLIETDRGTIRIETNADSAVPIRIRQGDEVVKRLTVDSEGASTRVRAGNYIVEYDGEGTSFELSNNRAVVKADDVWITRIEYRPKEGGKEWKALKDPNTIRKLALDDARHGRYDAALEKVLWYWDNAVTIQPSLSAVRRSFLLSDWLELGEAHPPALTKLISVRDRLRDRILSADQIRVRDDDFADLAALNRTLRQEDETIRVYELIKRKDPKDAERLKYWLPVIDPRQEVLKLSPFTDVQFEGEKVFVTYDGKTFQWLELDGLTVEEIITSAKRQFGRKWQKRVSEDLVEVLWGMNHEPGQTVKLRLIDLPTQLEYVVEGAPMTAENRFSVYMKRLRAEGKPDDEGPR
jgi:serine/threonine-protein kinase